MQDDVPPTVPTLGDLLAIERGPMYRVLDATPADPPGAYLLNGYEIWADPPVERVRGYLWRDGTATPVAMDVP